jgi:hypothetical protein
LEKIERWIPKLILFKVLVLNCKSDKRLRVISEVFFFFFNIYIFFVDFGVSIFENYVK